MKKPILKSRAPPGLAAWLSSESKALIAEAYPDLHERVDFVLTIELYLDHLNSQGRFEDAAEFLQETETGVKVTIRRRSIQRRRGVLRLVAASTLTTSVGVIVKFALAK